MARILGLDLGVASVGFALVDWDEASLRGSIIRIGVRIFPEGRDEDKEPRNKTRRDKRLLRRTLRRRKRRRRELAAILSEAGLLPPFSKDPASEWGQLMFGRAGSTRAARADIERALDPYELRRRALTDRLEPFALGRALYHLAKRRGFRGRDDVEERIDEARKKEDGIVTKAITGLRASLGGRTFGQYLSELPAGERKRGRHFAREMMDVEFEAIWMAQAPHHPSILTDNLKDRVRETIFFQRPVFWRLATLGACRFRPGSPLAAKASWIGQQYVMLEQLNKLRIAGGNARLLDTEERAVVLNLVCRKPGAKFTTIRKALKAIWTGRGESPNQIFNLEASLDSLSGNRLEADLARIFGSSWDSLPMREVIQSEIHTRLFSADTAMVGRKRVELRREREKVEARRAEAERMVHDWRITPTQAEALSALKLPTGWLRVSQDAIEAMMPELDAGVGVGELTMSPSYEPWRRDHFPRMERPTGEIRDRLPSRPAALGDVRNPSVTRTLNEVRKVVNNLLRIYGTPDVIRVELARDLKRNKKDRERTEADNRARARERKVASAELEQNGLSPSRRNIEKWLLWKECNETCPYTGDKIGFDELFRTGKYEVEHIWPQSRSLDDGFNNKTLCEVEFNRNRKGQRTPWEIFQSSEDDLHQLKMRLATCFGRDRDHPKIRRFLANTFMDAAADLDGFSARQLVDTRYAAVQVRDFLKRLYPDDGRVPPVETCNGSITAQLRRAWGLNGILDPAVDRKTRDDHRHHAVDALAVACTTRGFVKRLSDWHAARRTAQQPELAKPWEAFRPDASRVIGAIVVSHRVRKKVSGPLHAETVYGDTTEDVRTKSGMYREFVTRKAVSALSKSEIADDACIRDPAVREAIRAHVEARGGDLKKAFPPFPTLPNRRGAPIEIKRVRIRVRQSLDLMAAAHNGYVDPARNHHMAIYRERDLSIAFDVVTLFEASRRLAARESVVRARSSTDGTLLMSLSPGDTLAFPGLTGPLYRVVLSVWANGQIELIDHTTADRTVWSRPNPRTLLKAGASKVSIDPIGRITSAHD